MSEPTIPNWSIFATKSIGISLVRLTDETDDITVYQVMFDLSLDDGSDDSSDDSEGDAKHHISLITDIQSEDKMEAINIAMDSLLNSFSTILDEVIVVDSEHNFLENISLTDSYDGKSTESESVDENKPVLH